MVNNYESPMAKIVSFEAINIIAASLGPEADTPDNISTWGKVIGEYASAEVDLFS